jgi:hypothetical protein
MRLFLGNRQRLGHHPHMVSRHILNWRSTRRRRRSRQCVPLHLSGAAKFSVSYRRKDMEGASALDAIGTSLSDSCATSHFAQWLPMPAAFAVMAAQWTWSIPDVFVVERIVDAFVAAKVATLATIT